VKPPPFEYVQAESIAGAIDALSDAGSEAAVLAGGQSLLALMNLRRARPRVLVDINRVAAIDHCSPPADGAEMVIGATCRQCMLERFAPADTRWAALSESVSHIGNYVTRVRGTVGGSIAYGDPAAELPVVAVLFGGEVVAESAGGQRRIPIESFFRGRFETALAPGELLTEMRLHAPPPGAVTGFAEVSERIAIASAAVGIAVANGVCTWARIALGSVDATPVRAFEAERILIGSDLGTGAAEEAARAAAAGCSPASDPRGSARFRSALVETLAKRKLAELTDRLRAA
jgi:carbon-monoxide dehydrogenase medium subunit